VIHGEPIEECCHFFTGALIFFSATKPGIRSLNRRYQPSHIKRVTGTEVFIAKSAVCKSLSNLENFLNC